MIAGHARRMTRGQSGDDPMSLHHGPVRGCGGPAVAVAAAGVAVAQPGAVKVGPTEFYSENGSTASAIGRIPIFGGRLAFLRMIIYFCSWGSPHFWPGRNYESTLPLKIGIRPDSVLCFLHAV